MIRALLLMMLLALIPASQSSAQATTLTVFAAASLSDAFEEIGRDFEVANPGVEVLFNFAGSSALAAQIAAGAPADVFASANWPQMENVAQAGLLAGPPSAFARNRLTLVVPAANPAGITTVRDLATPGLKLVLPVSGVPARVYADSLLSRIAAAPTYGPAFLSGVYANLVSEEDNVRLAQVKVALGEADAGIVYTSDVTPDIADDVRVIALPNGAQPMISYPIAALAGAADPALAQAFIAAVLSPEGQAVLSAWGFQTAVTAAP
jgi:molybdate transport system substrate-binding protein